MITIAVSKGRIAKAFIEQLKSFGIKMAADCEKLLHFSDLDGTLRIIQVKGEDVPTYVDNATCDLGIVGSDILSEFSFEGYELMPLDIGKCKLCLAGPLNHTFNEDTWVRVASKYPIRTRNYLKDKGKLGTIVHLHGSVELGPVMGISDVIVDIVETGRTLKENNLVVIEAIDDICTMLIANPIAYKTKSIAILNLLNQIKSVEAHHEK